VEEGGDGGGKGANKKGENGWTNEGKTEQTGEGVAGDVDVDTAAAAKVYVNSLAPLARRGSIPDPSLHWASFEAAVEAAVAQAGAVWNAELQRPGPWINMDLLRRWYVSVQVQIQGSYYLNLGFSIL
jgi:hypothetical protein